MRSIVSFVAAVAVSSVLVAANPIAPRASAAPSTACSAVRDFDVLDAYQRVYVEGAGPTLLQFGDVPAVGELYTANQTHLFDAFVALHATGFAPADLTGPLRDGSVRGRGSRAATGSAILDIATTPGSTLAIRALPLVCDHSYSYDFWKVPLSDFCRALRAANADQQCSESLLRKAKKGLPLALAKVSPRDPVVVTTTTTSTTTTTVPYVPGPDGICPFEGQPCDSPLYENDPDPDCVCSSPS